MPRRQTRHRPPDRCYPAHDLRVSARVIQLASGLRVRVVECGPPEGDPVILLPGWGVSAFTYRHQLPALGEAGYRATAVDLKGHGFSDKPTGSGEYTFDAMLRHVREVIAAVTSRPAIVVGQSMAGPLALDLARVGTPAITRLVLVSPVGLGVIPFIKLARLLTPRVIDPIAPHLARRWTVRLGLRLAYGSAARVTEDTVEEYWAPAQFPGFARALRGLAHDFDWVPRPDADFAAVASRTLVLLGARDRLVRGSPQRAARIRGLRWIVVPDGGHAINEECPTPVNAAMLGFLAEGK